MSFPSKRSFSLKLEFWIKNGVFDQNIIFGVLVQKEVFWFKMDLVIKKEFLVKMKFWLKIDFFGQNEFLVKNHVLV